MHKQTENKVATQLGHQIKERRKELGVSQETLGEMLDVRREYLTRIEAGIHPQYFDRLVSLLEMVGLTLVAVPSTLTHTNTPEEHQLGDPAEDNAADHA